jgi:hypothetical protein
VRKVAGCNIVGSSMRSVIGSFLQWEIGSFFEGDLGVKGYDFWRV